LLEQHWLLEFTAVFPDDASIPKGAQLMLEQLNRLTLTAAISIASFEATFFVAADIFGLTDREVLLGVVAGAVAGLSVLVAVLWQSASNVTTQVAG
jgi:hypothetical protein